MMALQEFAAELRRAGREAAKTQMTDLRSLLSKLVESQVGFIIVGGAAAIAHGSPRLNPA